RRIQDHGNVERCGEDRPSDDRHHPETAVRLKRSSAAAAAAVALLAVACYASTATDFFLQDDFGVVGLLSQKPALFFPHWFVMPWTENIWGYSPDELRPFPAVSYQISSIFG